MTRGSLWRLPGRRLSLIMTELMRWHLRNHNCKQILLGISHDAGYAPFLDEVVTADERSRIAIIQGPPTVCELSATGLQIIDFKQIFRQEKLVNRSLSNTSPTLPSTWAGITSNSPSKNGASVKQPVPTTTPVWNPGPRGLDDPITLNTAALDKLRRRTNNKKVCNNHYLRGPCIKDDCTFKHDLVDLTDEELDAVAYLARLNPCLKGQDCEQGYCIYGHHCPSTTFNKKDNGWQCSAINCRFAIDAHPPNTLMRRKERWEREN